MIIDTHAHLNFDAFDEDRDVVIKRMLAENIQAINVGTSFATSKSAVELAERQEGFYAAIGLHPTDVDEELDIEAYKRLALSDSRRVVAIGEVGLDYFRKPFDREKQKEIFLKQLELAKELNLPVIIHCRKAHQDVLQILKSYVLNHKSLSGVVHCFTGTVKDLQNYLDLGFYIGLNGIMFKLNLDEVVRACPPDRMLLETDCPYLTPPQAPSKRNEPIFMSYTIQKIAELKGMSVEEVCRVTTQNSRKLFNI